MSDFDTMVKSQFMEYASEVIENRAIPKIEDGMKPIHRRVIYGMYDMKLMPNKPHVKSAKVVGEVMSRLHPHGDSSIYDTLIRLSQPWKMRYPLVEVHGNNGSIVGDSAAASRYTEARLTEIGALMCQGIEKNIEPTQLNYSGEEYEPLIMPSVFPNILVNPNLGIAVAMACNTYPHNLKEMCAALQAMVRNSDFNIDDFLQYVKGPDFPTGGIVLNGEELRDIYMSGRGAVKVQSKYHLEQIKNEMHIVITEVPYLTTMDKITGPITQMMNEGHPFFRDIQDNLGNKGFELRIILNKDVDVNKAIEVLIKETGFQSNLKFNNTLLVNGKPQLMSILDTMHLYLRHRHNMIIKEAQVDLAAAQKRVNIIDGLLIAIQDIDGVVTIIKGAADKNDARTKLIDKYQLNVEQANAILDMKLSRLTSLDTKKLVDERAELETTIERCETIINDKLVRDEMIYDQLGRIANKYGDNRRTEIQINTENVEVETIAEPINYYLTTTGLVKDKPENYITCIKARSKKEIVMYNAAGEVNVCDADNACGAFKRRADAQYLVCLASNGKIKKTLLSEFKEGKKTKAMKLAGEMLCAGEAADGDYMLMLTASGVHKIAIKDINATGKLTMGVNTTDEPILAACIAQESDTLLFVTEDMHGKLTLVRDLVSTVRGGKPQKVADHTIYMLNVTERDSVLLVGKIARNSEYNLSKLSVKSKTALGAQLTTKKIVSVR